MSTEMPETRFIDGMGWVVSCRNAVQYVRKLSELYAELEAECAVTELTDKGRELLGGGE